MFMTDKADAGKAGTIIDTLAKVLVRVWYHSIVVPPPVPFVLEISPAGVFKGGNNMIGGETPDIIVLSKDRPLAMVDVTGTKRFF